MSDDVPTYLMPLAAVLGMYSLFGGLRASYFVYKNLTKSDTTTTVPSLSSRSFITLAVSVVASVLLYGKVVASVNNALATSSLAHFDPYDLLQIPSGTSNVTEIKQAYRALSKLHHPDKRGGSEEVFHQIHLAYQALTDATAMRNYRDHGHPDGPPPTAMMAFALPDWLLRPQGNVAVILVLLYVGMFGLLIYAVLQYTRRTAQQEQDEQQAAKDALLYLARELSPDHKHLDILLTVITAPDMMKFATEAAEKVEELREKRLKEQYNKRDTSTTTSNATDLNLDDLGDDGWADEEEEDEDGKQAALKAQQEEERRQKEREQLKAAQGQVMEKLEGIDEGVLGQQWVEKTLAEFGQWPPKDLGVIKDKTFMYKGKSFSALEHAGIRRNLCMMMGRLNAIVLNGHVDLLEAGSKGLIDQTYFRASQEFRARVGASLERALRVALSFKSYRLAKTLVETIAMFKVGTTSPTDPVKIEWFRGVMRKQYGGDVGVPKLNISELKILTPGEDEVATGDTVAVELKMERPYAENFLKQKMETCKKQGVPPQLALQMYREGWWFFVRAEKVGGAKHDGPIEFAGGQLLEQLDDRDLEKYRREAPKDVLITAFPMIVQKINQQEGNVRVKFQGPKVAGKHRFHISIKSLDFLGADQYITKEIDIVDSATLTREQGEDNDDENNEGQAAEEGTDEEPKKEK